LYKEPLPSALPSGANCWLPTPSHTAQAQLLMLEKLLKENKYYVHNISDLKQKWKGSKCKYSFCKTFGVVIKVRPVIRGCLL
jgi:hypothetical protein